MQKDLKTLFGTIHGLDDKSLTFLTKALEKSNLPNFDYIEYKQALGNLQAMNFDEATMFKSAFATASTLGVTKDRLIQTAKHYKEILDKEQAQFDTALNKQMLQRVQGKLEDVERLKKQMEQYKQQIETLQERILKSQTTIDQADEAIQSAKAKIENTQSAFEQTHQSVVNQIEQDIRNIEVYL